MDNNNKNVDKKSLAYFAGQAVVTVFSLCLTALFVALCCKGILWILAL